jgi:hypothetical protein
MFLSFFLVHLYFVFWDTVSLYNWGWPWSHNPPASASRGLGLQVHTTTPVSQKMLWVTAFSLESIIHNQF